MTPDELRRLGLEKTAEWYEWTKEPYDWDKDFPPDWQAACEHSEETAHAAVAELLERAEGWEARP